MSTHTRADGQLAGPAGDGPCDDGCARVVGSTADQVPDSLTLEPCGPPIACTLEAGAMPDRVAEWQALLDAATGRERIADGALRVAFRADAPLPELARLVAAEQACCAFFSFAITVDQRGVGLEVRAPAGAEEVVTALFGGDPTTA